MSIDLDAVSSRAEKASQANTDVAKDRTNYRMSIPARLDDTDLVIQSALSDIPRLVDEVRSLRQKKMALEAELAFERNTMPTRDQYIALAERDNR